MLFRCWNIFLVCFVLERLKFVCSYVITILKFYCLFKIVACFAGETALRFVWALSRFWLWIQCYQKASLFFCFVFRQKWCSWASCKIRSSACWLLSLSDYSEVLSRCPCLWDWMRSERRPCWSTAWICNSSLPGSGSEHSHCKFILLLEAKLRFRILKNWSLGQYW